MSPTTRRLRERQRSTALRNMSLEQLEGRRLLAASLTSAMFRDAQAMDPQALRDSVSPGPDKLFYDYVDDDGQLNGGVVSPKTIDDYFLQQASRDFGPLPPSPLSDSSTIVNNGPSSNRIDLVMLGDGYTAGELGTYATHVTNLLAPFFALSPLDEYYNYFNVHRVDVISNQSGVDNDPNQGVVKDTALDAGYWCSGIERLLCVNTSKAAAEAASAPDVDQILVLANSTKYGGAGYPANNLGTVAGNNASAVEVAKHEFGHSFADLGDEYVGFGGNYSGPERAEANQTIQTAAEIAASQTKWHLWLDEPNVDAFAGAYWGDTGIYRPTSNSLMRSLGQPLEQVNVEQFVILTYQTVRPLDAATPAGTYDDNQVFSVTPVQPVNHDLDVQWFLDGNPIAGATNTTFDAATLGLSPGTYDLGVLVVDNTSMVRDENARATWLTDIRNWTIEVTAPEVQLVLDAAATYTENAVAIVVSPGADLTAPGFTNFDGGSLTVDYQSGGTSYDRLSIRNQGTSAGQIGVLGSQVTYAGTPIGSFSGGTGTAALVVSLNSDATVEATEALIRNIRYRAAGENPPVADRTLRMVVDDGTGSTSDPATMTISVVRVNDAPVLNNALTPTLNAINEDFINSTGKLVSSLLAGAVTDPDGLGVKVEW